MASKTRGKQVGTQTWEQVCAEAQRLSTSGTGASAGRLYHSARRWSWATRCVTSGEVEDLGNGSRFEPVVVYPTAAWAGGGHGPH